MHSQRGITHQSDMDLAGATVQLISVKPGGPIVLRQARAIADGFPKGHVLEEPMWPAGTAAGQAVTGQGQHRPLEVVFRIPIPEPTAKEQREHSFHIAFDQLGCDAIVESVRVAEPADTRVTARPAAVSPQIRVRT